MEVGQAELDAGKEQAAGEAVHHQAALVARQLEVEGAHLDGARDLRTLAGGRVELAHRQQQQLGLAAGEALADRIERVHRLDRVAEQLQAERACGCAGGKTSMMPPRTLNVAAILDQRHAPIAPADEACAATASRSISSPSTT